MLFLSLSLPLIIIITIIKTVFSFDRLAGLISYQSNHDW